MFKNRIDAGNQLAQKLSKYKNDPKAIVVGLPKGGLLVAKSVARNLELPLDMILVRKIFMRDLSSYPVGAINRFEDLVADPQIMEGSVSDKKIINHKAQQQLKTMEHLAADYESKHSPMDLNEKVVILVDDGIVTGFSMLAAIYAIEKQQPKKIVVAVPLAADGMVKALPKSFKKNTVEIISIDDPLRVFSKEMFYDDFPDISHRSAQELLRSDNDIVADIFSEIADFLDLQNENAFRIEAYLKAAKFIRSFKKNITSLSRQELIDLPTIGEALAGFIIEYKETGKIAMHEQSRGSLPKGLRDLLALDGLGIKRTKQLYHELGIHSLSGLRKAASLHELQKISGFQKKTEENLLQEIERMKVF